MKSIFQLALGADFERLHPEIQKRFSLTPGLASVGRGRMENMWIGSRLFKPFLRFTSHFHILFPEIGKNVSFQIENYGYTDQIGRDTVTFVRTFQFPKAVRRFDAQMIFSRLRNNIVDYLGNDQALATDLQAKVTEQGGICFRSGQQRLHLGPLSFRLPRFLVGIAEVCEWFDDVTQEFRITVTVKNPLFGRLCGYAGRFKAEFFTADPKTIPPHIVPKHVESRD